MSDEEKSSYERKYPYQANFRFTPEENAKLEKLIELFEEERGTKENRSTVIRYLIHAELMRRQAKAKAT